MGAIRKIRSYTKLPDTDIRKFTGGTMVGLKANPALPSPPVDVAALGTLKTTFDEAIIKANKGGTLATAKKDAARAALVAALDKNASYVDINCEEDMTILLSAGYEAVSTNRAQAVLDPPVIVAVDYGQSGQI